ncbi:MAG: short chain dehydrogenase [Desulfovibrionales bacterium]|nr:short chain dehydrogenase [Desulfovibrionales bacterium]
MQPTLIVIGATGLIGSHLVADAKERFSVISVSRHSAPSIDMTQPESIRTFFAAPPPFTHIAVTAGETSFKLLPDLTEEELLIGIRSKMMGQMLIALEAYKHLPPHGSITLTGGVTARKPFAGTAGTAFVNGALNAFAHAASLEFTEGRRINVISPGWIRQTAEKMGVHNVHTVEVEEVARAYRNVIEGDINGQVIEV